MGEIVSVKDQYMDVASFIKANEKKLNSLASKMIDPHYLVAIAMGSLRRNPKLLSCNRSSLLNAILISAKVGLMPDEQLGEAALVPFKQECVFIPMYGGLITLAVRNGATKNMWATPVFACDEYEEFLGTDPHIVHRPGPSDERGTYEQLVACYAVAQLTTGSTQHWAMSKKDIDAVRKKAPSYNYPDSPHQKWPLDMCIKTPLRRLFKYIPKKGPELSTALIASDRSEMGEPQADLAEIDFDLKQQEQAEGSKSPKSTSIPSQTKVEKTAETQGKARVDKPKPQPQSDTPLNKLTQEKKAALEATRTSIRALLITLAGNADEANTILEQCSFEQDDDGRLKRSLTITTLDWNEDSEYLASTFRRLQEYQQTYAQESGADQQTQSKVEPKQEMKEKARKAPQVQGLFPQK